MQDFFETAGETAIPDSACLCPPGIRKKTHKMAPRDVEIGRHRHRIGRSRPLRSGYGGHDTSHVPTEPVQW
jgi:hypothetical protein